MKTKTSEQIFHSVNDGIVDQDKWVSSKEIIAELEQRTESLERLKKECVRMIDFEIGEIKNIRFKILYNDVDMKEL